MLEPPHLDGYMHRHSPLSCPSILDSVWYPHAQITAISPSWVATRYIYLVGNKRWSHDLDDLNTFFWYQKLFKNLKTITIIPPTSWTGQRTVTTLNDEDLTQNASLIRNGTVHFIFANARLSNLWTVDMIIMGSWAECRSEWQYLVSSVQCGYLL